MAKGLAELLFRIKQMYPDVRVYYGCEAAKVSSFVASARNGT